MPPIIHNIDTVIQRVLEKKLAHTAEQTGQVMLVLNTKGLHMQKKDAARSVIVIPNWFSPGVDYRQGN